MKRTVIAVSIISSILGICCAAAIVVGRSQPAPILFPGFSRCNLNPCILEIVPGKTSWLSAKSHFPNLEFDADIEIQYDANTHFYFLHSMDYSGVDQAGATFAPGTGPTLGTLISVYGVPCKVRFDPVMSFLILRYQYANVFIGLARNQTTIHLTPYAKIDNVTFRGAADVCSVGDKGEWPWQGFKQLSY